jgi:DNA-binding IclR family transcriptional regulator
LSSRRDRTYRAGSAFADLGGGPNSATALLGIARPHLARLAELAGETSNLMMLAGSDVQFIDSIECNKALRVGTRVGVRLPARLTSGGEVLLADLPFEEVALLHPQLADDHAGMSAVKRMLSATRRQGFGTNFQESERGVIRQERRPVPSSHQNAHPHPSEWPLTCYFSIPRRVKTAFCPPRVREFRVAQVSAPRPGKPVH